MNIRCMGSTQNPTDAEWAAMDAAASAQAAAIPGYATGQQQMAVDSRQGDAVRANYAIEAEVAKRSASNVGKAWLLALAAVGLYLHYK